MRSRPSIRPLAAALAIGFAVALGGCTNAADGSGSSAPPGIGYGDDGGGRYCNLQINPNGCHPPPSSW